MDRIIALTISSNNTTERHKVGINRVTKIENLDSFIRVYFDDESYAVYPERVVFSLIFIKKSD